jgi:pyrimidine operon attenuation protein / uracil phosphoribosyltransferase
MDKIKLLDSTTAKAKLTRMAFEIVEQNCDEKVIIIAGIKDRGYLLAELIVAEIALICKIRLVLISIEIDKNNPTNCYLSDSKSLDAKSIIIVDDVANSGRTLLYALNPFLNVLAKRIQIAVMVDRRHKNYPIAPDYVGLSVSTTLQEHINLEFKNGVIEAAYLV